MRKDIKYINYPLCLDTETSWNHDFENPIAWIYQWATAYCGEVTIGRRPSEILTHLDAMKRRLNLNENTILVIYVHNLSFDIIFLYQWLEQHFGQKGQMLAVKEHKILSYSIDAFEFRCSYILSNRSLAKWGADLGVEHQKKEGAVDYSVIRYQHTPLTHTDDEYLTYDVLSLEDCVYKQMSMYGDSLSTIPLTSTSYIRRDARKNYKSDRKNRKQFLDTALDATTYSLCRQEFAGAITHGNRYYIDTTLTGTIRHRDFLSHYPSQQRTRKFPMGRFCKYKDSPTYNEIIKLTDKYCLLLDIVIVNPEIRSSDVTFPMLQRAKCYQGRLTTIKDISDNGRIIKMQGATRLVMTELDFKWLIKQYKSEFKIISVYVSYKDYLPRFMIDTIDAYMINKTRFKRLEHEARERGNIELADDYLLSLLKSKNGLNGIFGMSATDIVRAMYAMSEDGTWTKDMPQDIDEALQKYYRNYNNFMRYQWGIFTTSYARDELLTYTHIIDTAGRDEYPLGATIYGDTDSNFYFSNNTIEKAIEAENKKRQEAARKIGAYVDVDGKRVIYDCFNDEGEDIKKFRFLHAKCYAYETDTLQCTIAGVPKHKYIFDSEGNSVKFKREEELENIDRLTNGTKFNICGGTRAIYTHAEPTTIFVDENAPLEYASGVIIAETEKTLHDTLNAEIYNYMEVDADGGIV